ncbi:unnamed protein product [Zymoseptoria tritici ST99CH_3D1]|nr:unnamed protein product [Zymoseptoria tritici ST99CH_3D1]
MIYMKKANNAPPRAPPAAMMGTAVAGATPPDFVDVDASVELAAEEEPEALVVLAPAAADVPLVALLVLKEAEEDLLELAEEGVVAAAPAAPVLGAVEDEAPDLEAEDETKDEEDPDLEAEEEEGCAVARAAMPRTKIVENCIVGEVVLGSGVKTRVFDWKRGIERLHRAVLRHPGIQSRQYQHMLSTTFESRHSIAARPRSAQHNGDSTSSAY